jgi:hypothetical protein
MDMPHTNGQAIAYLYNRENEAEARQGKHDETRNGVLRRSPH